jgi:D-glycero-D-manno-heptose 1,7-bisphosphate phosphatase
LAADDLAAIHEQMGAAVAAAGGCIERIYACTHLPEARCACRKPGTGLFTRASTELGILLKASLMVGDALTDVEAARAAGCRPILVAADRTAGHEDGVAIVRDLSDVVPIYSRMREEAEAKC